MPHWNLLQLSNYLRDQGVKKGDAVAIYMPMLVELPIAMLACARIGAVHSVRMWSLVGRHCCFWHNVITLSVCHHVEV
jgi:acyl-coenzyme A synthetase/AMP-(fatty) acid ligase